MTPQSVSTSLQQVVDEDGNPCKATATTTIWVGYGEGQQFSSQTEGNLATPYSTSEAYYRDLHATILAAKEEILIAGWQVNWDALLVDGDRLFDVLLAAAKKSKVKIYVMPWNDSAPVQTFDDQTKSVLLLINDIVDRKAVHICLAGSLADESRAFFSHHQKQVVIDRKIAYVGGVDLAYGRLDNALYDLKANAAGREVLNRYNGCIAQVGKVPESMVVDTDLLTGAADRTGIFSPSNRTLVREKIESKKVWQTAYQEDSPGQEKTGGSNLSPVYVTIDEKTQPRMPWQDAHAKVEGPAVSCLTRNFVMRWNGQQKSPKLAMPAPPSAYAKKGNCEIQVLRSAPKGLRDAEYEVMLGSDQEKYGKPTCAQNDIHRAMIKLIRKAEHFIYIENQFFVSEFGRQQGVPENLSGPASVADSKSWGLDQTSGAYLSTTRFAGDRTTAAKLPQNQICAELASRIDIAIKDAKKQPFHVMIVLPVHPEGALNNGAIMTQVHWTMQSLVFGSHSLLNRIRRSIKAQELREKKKAGESHINPERVFELSNREYETVPFSECDKYVTLLNLRNWELLGDRYVTEQIYVHSKLMIVDDRYALLGSANINDRSLLGGRDSELAVLVLDGDVERKDICKNGKKVPVRCFAHDLRRQMWKKIFGLSGDELRFAPKKGDPNAKRGARRLADIIDHPGSPETWKLIQDTARTNTAIYDAAFQFIPRNHDPYGEEEQRPASIWPVWDTNPELIERKRADMPFESGFWTKKQHQDGAINLTGVRGHIVSLPIKWTFKENNNFGFHNALMVENLKKDDETKIQNGRYAIAAKGKEGISV